MCLCLESSPSIYVTYIETVYQLNLDELFKLAKVSLPKLFTIPPETSCICVVVELF